MANRYNTSVQWSLEPAVVVLSVHVTFGANGVPTVDAINSKGIANVWNQSLMFSGAVASGSATITSVTSFSGLFTGMTISGSGVSGSPTIGTISAATGSIVLSAAASLASTASSSFAASGGRFIYQFGLNNGNRLDPYYKLLDVHTSWDETSGSASGIGVASLAPVSGQGFMVANNSRVRTIPSTQATASTDCSIALQYGTGVGTGFVAKDPLAGEALRVLFTFGNSSAI